MGLQSFRITNFRSIVDSGWVDLARDGVTVLVGQNESGKTSVLQALSCALGISPVTSDDRRVNASDPVIYLRVHANFGDIDESELQKYAAHQVIALKDYLEAVDGVVELVCRRTGKQATSLTDLEVSLSDETGYAEALRVAEDREAAERIGLNVGVQQGLQKTTVDDDDDDDDDDNEATRLEGLDSEVAAGLIHSTLPLATLFSAETGLLPNTVDVDEKGKPVGPGAVAASNFLSIAEIDLPALVRGDGRYRQNVLNRANRRLSDDFASFWSQVIGAASRLTLQCGFEYYSSAFPEKAGKPYLEFWISDGNTQLYPKQRSQGVRWFVSFYLQLRASEKSKHSRIFLLDEPGANLHDKAQEDVLRLVDQLRKEIPIVYSTHSPKMIEYEKLYRIRAVQRDGAQEDSPTILIDAQHLGAASSDTLSPLLAAMGSDMSQQAVVKRNRNVLLEEISGYYYLKAFWKLLDRKEEAHFIAATGVNKIPQLSNMFLGWGLDFIVAVDDDKQGREVFNQLKKDLCGDKDDLAAARLLKFRECTCIEEVFSATDFKRHVLRAPQAPVGGSNAEYMKTAKLSKPITALEFLLEVEKGTIVASKMEESTLGRMRTITDGICEMLDVRENKSVPFMQ